MRPAFYAYEATCTDKSRFDRQTFDPLAVQRLSVSRRAHPLRGKSRFVSETLPLGPCEVRSHVGEVNSLGLRTALQRRGDEALHPCPSSSYEVIQSSPSSTSQLAGGVSVE